MEEEDWTRPGTVAGVVFIMQARPRLDPLLALWWWSWHFLHEQGACVWGERERSIWRRE